MNVIGVLLKILRILWLSLVEFSNINAILLKPIPFEQVAYLKKTLFNLFFHGFLKRNFMYLLLLNIVFLHIYIYTYIYLNLYIYIYIYNKDK